MDLINKIEDNDLPPLAPWDERPISYARWRKHHHTMLAQSFPGQRPDEWWAYEKKMWPRPHREAEALYEMGELSEAELAELMPSWRGQYERAQEPDFAYCIGAKPGDTFASWIEGDAAREAFYDWAAIPRALIRQWDAVRDAVEKLHEDKTAP